MSEEKGAEEAKDEKPAEREEEEVEEEFDLDENGNWRGVCLDDGTGRDVYYIDTRGIRSRREPPGYHPEYFENGDRRYYYRQKCIRCRKAKQPAIYMTDGAGGVGYSLNYCSDCHIAATAGIKRLNGNGEGIYQANIDTPKSAWIDLKKSTLNPDRYGEILERSVDARHTTRKDQKLFRNRIRYSSFKSEASQYDGIDLIDGKYVSWGFEDFFDEYFGDVNEEGKPHGFGLKVFSDETIYFGGFRDGMFDTTLETLENGVIGTLIKPNGATYEGTFVHGLKHGKGTQIYPDGTKYDGEFAKGFEHGQGTKTYAEKDGQSSFTGRFRFGRKDGPGTMTHADGSTHKGNFLDPAEKYNEKSVPYISEEINTKDEFYEPETLLKLSIDALGKAMHANKKAYPAPLLQRRVPEHLKYKLGEVYLSKLDPPGSPAFVKVGPEFAFNFLTELLFCGVRVIEADAMALMYFQNSNRKLEILKCTANKMTLPSIDLICKNLQQVAWPLLKELDLSFNAFDVPALLSLVSGLKTITSLRSLRLAACGIKAGGIYVISEYLIEDTNVTSCDLSFNSAELAGAEHMSRMLASNKTCTSLNLRSNKLGANGGMALARAMSNNKVMRVMCLADNLIGADIVSDIGAKLNGSFRDALVSACHDQLMMPVLYEEGRYDHFKRRNAEKFKAMEGEDSDSD
jgi:hypothetical protein